MVCLLAVRRPRCDTVQRRFDLPLGMLPGVVIGGGGANLKRLRQATNAYFSVTDTDVIIRGERAAVDEGEVMLKEQFRQYQIKGTPPVS